MVEVKDFIRKSVAAQVDPFYMRVDGGIFILTGERPADSIARFNAAQIEDSEAAELAATVFAEGSEDVFSIPLLDATGVHEYVTEDEREIAEFMDDFYEQGYPGAF